MKHKMTKMDINRGKTPIEANLARYLRMKGDLVPLSAEQVKASEDRLAEIDADSSGTILSIPALPELPEVLSADLQGESNIGRIHQCCFFDRTTRSKQSPNELATLL